MPPKLKSAADLEKWEEKKGFKGVIASGGFKILRKCVECDQPTNGLDEPKCGKHGGKRQVQVRDECHVDGCTKRANQANGTMCNGCWVAADPAERGCPGCQRETKHKSRPDGLCANCVGKAGVKAKREARRPELAQLCEDEGIEEGPTDVADAAFGTRYAVLNKHDDYMPHVCVRSGKELRRACAVRGCVHEAKNVPGTPKTHCFGHGGGHRCAVEGAHLVEVEERGFAPYAGYVLSEQCALNGVPKPEWAGTRCCMGCLKRLEPTHAAVRVHVRKEHLMVAAIAEALHARGRGDLVGKLRHDCAAGPSRRRADLALRPSGRFLIDFENDEDQHKDRTTSCERRKLAGHLADHGAPAYSEAEGKLWDPPHPSEEELEALRGTPSDTPALERLRLDRRRATQRVLRDYAVANRGLGEGEVLAPKLHVLRANCDRFVAADGTKVGALFHSTGDKALDAAMRLKPTKAFAPAVARIADRLAALCDAQADDAWFEARPELTVEYHRYDGCARDGADPNGAVAAAHAALDPHAARATPGTTARMDAIKAAAAKKRKAPAT
jgi:hypothetical protein